MLLKGLSTFFLVQIGTAVSKADANLDVDTDTELNEGYENLTLMKDILKFKANVPFGKAFNVHFNYPKPPPKGTHPWIGIYIDDGTAPQELPDSSNLVAWQWTCGGQDECKHEDKVQRGVLTFGPKDPDSSEEYHYPMKSKSYLVCAANYEGYYDGGYYDSLVTDCEPFTVLPHKPEMITKARVNTKRGLKIKVSDPIIAKFRTPIAIANQWIGLYPELNGKPPEGDLDCLSTMWVYTGCDGQDGDQDNDNCVKRKKRGEVTLFGDEHMDTDCDENSWPVPAGYYYLCVVFTDDAPYLVYKCSDKFEVTPLNED